MSWGIHGSEQTLRSDSIGMEVDRNYRASAELALSLDTNVMI